MKAQPLHVLQVLDALGVGGAETWLMQLLRHWSKTGAVRADFLLTGGEPAAFDEEARALGARLHYLRYGRRELAAFVPAYRKILREGGYDAIHDHSDYASGWHYLMGAGVLPPVRMTHVHNPRLYIDGKYATTATRRLVTRAGERLVHRFATHVGGTSSEALADYGFTPGARPAVSVVHCGFDVGAYSAPREADRASVLDEFGWPADARVILFVGRLDADLEIGHPLNHKNSWLAVNIAREAVQKDPRARLLMAGDGPAQPRIESRIAEWGMSDRLRLLGVRHDVPRLMRAADVLLFPSASEGLGMVAVEAQAAGLPVLASDAVPLEARVIPELYEALSLDEPPAAWADALLRLATRPRTPPETYRQVVENSPFSVVESARRLEAIYGSCR